MNLKKNISYRCLVAMLFIALAAQCSYSVWKTGQTTDETFFSSSGYPIVRYNNYEFLGEHPPLIMQLGGLPLLAIQPAFPIKDPLYVPGTDRLDLSRNGSRFLYKMGNNPDLILWLERAPIVLLTLLLAMGLFFLAGEIFGQWGALLSLALFAFDPNVIAHGSLFTTDMGLTVFYFFTIYALKRFFDAPSARRAVFLGLACGAAFMSKISSLILLPVISSLFLIYSFCAPGRALGAVNLKFEKWIFALSFFIIANAIGERQAMVLFGPLSLFAFYLCGRDLAWIKASSVRQRIFRGLVIGGGVLCAVYSWRLKKKYGINAAVFLTLGMVFFAGIAAYFNRFPATDNKIRLLKYFFSIWVLAALIIVLGYTDILYKFYRFIGFGNYMKPLGIVLSHSRGGHGACLEGSFVTCDWRYFPSIVALKTPLVSLALIGLGAFCFLFSKRSLLTKSLLFIPALFFFGAAMMNKIHIGLRHLLPVFPFLFLLAGFPAAWIGKLKPGTLKTTLTSVLLVCLAVSLGRTLTFGTDRLAYFNELVGGVDEGAKLVADSNLNWGQDNKRLAEFVIARKLPFITIGAEAMNQDIYNYYKIPWKTLESKDLLNPTAGFYALGIGYYMAQQKDSRSWFYGKQPFHRVGKTFYVFEVPEKRIVARRVNSGTSTRNADENK